MKTLTYLAVLSCALILASCGGEGPATAGSTAPDAGSANATTEPGADAGTPKTESAPPLPENIRALVLEFGSSDEFDRVGAVMALATKDGRTHPEVQDLFRKALKDSSSDVRAEAIKALPSVCGDEAYELIKPLIKDGDTTVRKAAISTLGASGKSDLAPVLEPCLEDSESSVQLVTLDALARLKNPAVLPSIEPLLFAADGTKIQQAIKAVVALDGKGQIDTIRGLLIDMNPDVRSAAAQALGALGANDKKSLVGLAGLLTDELEGVRKSASESLTQLTGAEIEYFYDEADKDALKEGAQLWQDWIAENK